MSIKTKCVWMILGLLHSVACHNYYVACKTPLVLSGHREFQYQTVPGAGQVKLRRNQDVLECGSELISGESLGVDVRNTVAGGEDLLEILGGASITTPGAKCSKTRALSTNVMVLVSKGEVTIQLAYGNEDRGLVYISPICKYTISAGAGSDLVKPANQSVACRPLLMRIGEGCHCPSANHSLIYGESCEVSVPFIHFWNGTVDAAPMVLGQGSAAVLRLDGVQAILDPPRSLSVQVATYDISLPAHQRALGLDRLGLPEPVSLLADVRPAGLLFRASLAGLTLAYNPRLVNNASALLALHFNESAALWESVAAAHNTAAGTFSLPLAVSGRYAIFEPRPAAAAAAAQPPRPPSPPAGLYAEACLAVLSLSAAFAFLAVCVPVLVRGLEQPDKAAAWGSAAAAKDDGKVGADTPGMWPLQDPA